jgi:O-methyltransferase
MDDAPAQSYRLLRKFLPRKLQPILRGVRKRVSLHRPRAEPFRTVFPYTQVHPTSQENLLRIAADIESHQIPGDIVECGVLDGGTAALMAFGTKTRPVHLFDSWEGLPEITEKDGDASMWVGEVVGSPRRVVSVLKVLNVDLDRVTFHRGWFDKTFPIADINQIALLHIDADFYESVRLALERWAPIVASGGYIQIDDYSSFAGCRKAVDEYLEAHPDLVMRVYKNVTHFLQVR